MPPIQRRKKLIRPRLQLKLALSFAGVALLGLTLQSMLFLTGLTALANELPNDGPVLVEVSIGEVLRILAITAGVVLPLTVGVGILLTFRIAGPVHRIEEFLRAVVRGERPTDFRLRKGDELVDLAELAQRATASVREREKAPRRRDEAA